VSRISWPIYATSMLSMNMQQVLQQLETQYNEKLDILDVVRGLKKGEITIDQVEVSDDEVRVKDPEPDE
jgi:hypothetical protein